MDYFYPLKLPGIQGDYSRHHLQRSYNRKTFFNSIIQVYRGWVFLKRICAEYHNKDVPLNPFSCGNPHIKMHNHLRKPSVVAYQLASVFMCSLFISALFVLPLEPGFSIRISLKGGKCSRLLTASFGSISPWCFSFHFEKKRENNVTLCYIQWGRKKEPNTEKAQTRQKWGQDETET